MARVRLDLPVSATRQNTCPYPVLAYKMLTNYFPIVLLGDIGGQVGLFLGASILTVLEFCDLLARIIVNKVKQRKRRRARTV